MSNTTPPTPDAAEPAISFADFQRLIDNMYGAKDRERGVEGTFMWLIEEVGELATALRDGKTADLAGEFADVIAWLTTIANVAGVDLTAAIIEKYGRGCPGCRKLVCGCPPEEKP
jgi:NTP pyrophosphatase (non-canonical NTP hydrolase)